MRPITDLRNTNDISDACHAVNEHVFITKNGYGDMIVMSIETYEQIAENHRIDDAIAESEAEYQAQGVLLDAAETLSGGN
ncbi:MAG: type II toxin-antitoxin system Phd/YefM family antitoxin [Clostridiaceae bacterium]